MKVNLQQISTLVLLLMFSVGCSEVVIEKDDNLKGQKVAHTSKMLVGQIAGDRVNPIMTDKALIESLFREAYPYASGNLMISKSAYQTYQPFQLEYDDMNAYRKRMYYLTALAEDNVSKYPVFLRVELSQEGSSLYFDPEDRVIMHIHTCSPTGAATGEPCKFSFTAQGFYDGCSCGGDVSIFDSRITDF
jgi:hypothetical protein